MFNLVCRPPVVFLLYLTALVIIDVAQGARKTRDEASILANLACKLPRPRIPQGRHLFGSVEATSKLVSVWVASARLGCQRGQLKLSHGWAIPQRSQPIISQAATIPC